jgi:hypothetical protein
VVAALRDKSDILFSLGWVIPHAEEATREVVSCRRELSGELGGFREEIVERGMGSGCDFDRAARFD